MKRRPGLSFDVAGMAVGTLSLDKILVGRDCVPGDAVIGIASSGIHSNGLTMARKVLFEQAGLSVATVPDELGCPLGEELLKPTHIYVREAVETMERGLPVRAFVHITSDGFLNLPRIEAPDTVFVLDSLLEIPPIFSVIRRYGSVAPEQMFLVYNMGVGMCVIVDPAGVDEALSIIGRHGKKEHGLKAVRSEFISN